MKFATKPQIQKIQILIKDLGLAHQKDIIISDYSDKRTTSTKELYMDQARELIKKLCELDPSEKIKSLIFSLAYRAGIIYGDTPADKKINATKLNMFLKERGSIKKELNSMNHTELVKVHRQFEAIVRNTQKSHDNKMADSAVNQLLEELNIIH